MRRLRITFVLPGSGCTPVGGFKVVYEYANHLARLGHALSIVHAASADLHGSLLKKGYCAGRYFSRKVRGGVGPANWFKLDHSIRMLWTPSLAEQYIPDSDIVVASSWYTAEWVALYPERIGRRFYLIQGFEIWQGQEERVTATWKAKINKIVISRWLEEIATGLGEQCWYVPNGLDFKAFNLTDPIELRPSQNILTTYHSLDSKGSSDGLNAIVAVKSQIATLKATIFGVPARPKSLPAWIDYYCQPSQDVLCSLYNAASIFVAPSWSEGWGLPASEAMMCGAALVATNIGGHQEFATHEETALLSLPKEPTALASNMLKLLADNALRIEIARKGNRNIQQFTWKRAVTSFESILASAKL